MGLPLRKYLVPELILGDGSVNLVNQYVSFFRPRKLMIVTDPGIKRIGLIDRIEKKLLEESLPYVIYDNITPNPKDYEVMQGVDYYRKENCNVILAVGGGSPIDAAKGIAIVSSNGGNVDDYEGVDRINVPMPPLVCVPTTAGTSADISQFSIILNTIKKIKIAIISKTTVPDIALIDAETTLTMDRELTAATGIDALVHAMEAYVSTASSELTNRNALDAIKLIGNNLVNACNNPGNMLYRDNMMLASLLAGMAFSNASLGLVHAMAHSLGGLKNSAHGLCNAILIDHVVKHNFNAVPDKYRDIAIALGVDCNDENPDKVLSLLIERLKEIKDGVGISAGLKSVGVKKEEIENLAVQAFNDSCMATNPVDSQVNDIINVFEDAW